MGTWGNGIMENDLAQDVKATFEDALEQSKSMPKAIQAVREQFVGVLSDPDDYPDLILALAWLAGSRGKVPKQLLDEAVQVVRDGLSLKKWAGSDEYNDRRIAEAHFLQVLAGVVPHPEPNKPRKHAALKLGDIMEIPLVGGLKAFAQYVFRDEQYGLLIRVFDLKSKDVPSLERILASGLMFPPIYTIPQVAVRDGRWRVIGNNKVEGFSYPVFKHGHPDRDGKVSFWSLFDGKQFIKVGALPPGAEKFEVLVIWGLDAVEQRIETGANPYGHWR